MGLTCEELVERVFAAPSVARLSALTLRTYRNSGAVPLLEHFSSIGLGCWSAPHAMAHLRALREEREAGRVSETRFRATRKVAALVNEMDAVGFLTGNTLPDYSYENPLVLLFNRDRCVELAEAGAEVYSLAAKVSIEVARLGIHGDKDQKCMVSRELSRLVAFFAERGCDSYSDEMLDAYVSHISDRFERGEVSNKRLLQARRIAMYARCVAEDGALTWAALRRGNTVILPDTLECTVDRFYSYVIDGGLAESTAQGYAHSAREFLSELDRRGVDVPYGMSAKDVRDGVVAVRLAKGSGKVPSSAAIRAFCRFCAYSFRDVGVADLSAAVPPPSPRRRRAIRGFDAQQSRKLLEAPDRGSARGRRDFAILSLAHATGMRACDIVGLELDSVDWRSNCIRLVQRKTSEPLVIPLDAEVGHAIATYILGGRPQTEDRHVFIRCVRPYIGLSSAAVRDVIVTYGHVLGPDPGVSLTPKSFRIGFSEGMTKAGVSLDGTRDLMGHVDWRTTRRYVPPDVERLHMCPLSLGGIPVKRKELL